MLVYVEKNIVFYSYVIIQYPTTQILCQKEKKEWEMWLKYCLSAVNQS
jgi:hypothetical protein